MKRLFLTMLAGVLPLLTLTSCGQLTPASKAAHQDSIAKWIGTEPTTTVVAGTYEGAAKGYHGDILVSMTIDATGYLTVVEVMQQTETTGIGDVATDQLPRRILLQQSLNVDVVAGATITSKAILAAAAQAVAKGGINPSDLGYHTPADKI